MHLLTASLFLFPCAGLASLARHCSTDYIGEGATDDPLVQLYIQNKGHPQVPLQLK